MVFDCCRRGARCVAEAPVVLLATVRVLVLVLFVFFIIVIVVVRGACRAWFFFVYVVAVVMFWLCEDTSWNGIVTEIMQPNETDKMGVQPIISTTIKVYNYLFILQASIFN